VPQPSVPSRAPAVWADRGAAQGQLKEWDKACCRLPHGHRTEAHLLLGLGVRRRLVALRQWDKAIVDCFHGSN